MGRKDCDRSPRLTRPLRRMMSVLVVAAVLAFGTPSQGQSGGIRIWPKAAVEDDVIRLGDVAQFTGFADQASATLSSLVVGQAPDAGQRLILTHREVMAKARAAGLNLAQVRLSGATHCEVSRPGLSPAPRPSPEPRPTVHPIARPDETPARAGRTLEEAVMAHIRALLAEHGGEVQVSLDRSARSRPALSLSEPPFAFRIRLKDPLPLGLVSLEAEVLDAGRIVQTVPLIAEVALVRQVAVARRPINRGMPIADKEVALAARRFTSLDQLGVTDLSSLVGQQARRFIERGEVFTARDVTPVPLVKRGQLVTVYHRLGGMMIRTVGKALEGGTYGSVIPVKNEGSNRSFQARISGPQTVEVLAHRTATADQEADS